MSEIIKALVLKEKVTLKEKVSPELSDSVSPLSDTGSQALIVERLNGSLFSALELGCKNLSGMSAAISNKNPVKSDKYPNPTVMVSASQCLEVHGSL